MAAEMLHAASVTTAAAVPSRIGSTITHDLFFRIDGAQLFDDLEPAARRLGDVHVHADVMLPRHHFRRAAGALRDLRMVERRYHLVPVDGARLAHRSLPELHAAVETGAGTAGGELRAAGEQPVIAGEQIAAERIVDLLVIVEAAVETFDLLSRYQIEEVLVEVGAGELTATLLEAGIVEFLKERRETRRDDRIENNVGTAGRDLSHRLAIVPVIEGKVLLPDNLAAVRGNQV